LIRVEQRTVGELSFVRWLTNRKTDRQEKPALEIECRAVIIWRKRAKPALPDNNNNKQPPPAVSSTMKSKAEDFFFE
jgi:hypothetical protein